MFQVIRRNISSLAYLLNACVVDVCVIAAFVHVCVATLYPLQQHADKVDAVAKAVLAAGLFAQARAWRRLSQHDATKPRTTSNAPSNAPSNARSNAPRKQRITILTHNIWVHYLATPVKQFKELDVEQSEVHSTMNGLDFRGRLREFARNVKESDADVVMVPTPP